MNDQLGIIIPPMTEPPQEIDTEPDWAPDGRHIIYRQQGEFIAGESWDDNDPKVHGSLWIMDVNSREQRQFLAFR